jgi:phosphatidylserine/phosphatidylglycerophosphate/cardiolipin synthase-like enzyme
MKLIVQPDAGLSPLLRAIKRAKTSIDLIIFRADLPDVEKALAKAHARGVAVRALIAHTNRGGDRKLRKLERRLLEAGVTVARTGDDLVRYHGKLLIIDAKRLFVLGFNYTQLDIEQSRSFGVVTRNRALIGEARRLIDADTNRHDFAPTRRGLVVSPENARQRLAAFIRKARRELLIYDPNLSDDGMIALLKRRAEQGVEIRILGKLEKKWRGSDLCARGFPGRLHVRAIVRDRRRAFVGSQSLRKLELDERREVGVVVRDRRVVSQLAAVFERDWKRAR